MGFNSNEIYDTIQVYDYILPVPGVPRGPQTRAAETPGEPEDAI